MLTKIQKTRAYQYVPVASHKNEPVIYTWSDQCGFNKHLKGFGVEGKRTFNSQYIKEEEVRLLRDNALIREPWVRWFHKLLNTKPSTLDPSIVDEP